MSPSNDLHPSDLPQLDWTDPSGSLSTIHTYVDAEAKRVEEWYRVERKPKKRAGRVLRLTAILLGGAGAVLPLLGEVLGHDNVPAFAPAWASLALVLAGVALALDRYFGFSDSWTRFMVAQLEAGKVKHHFGLEWEAKRAAGATPSELVGVAQATMESLDQVVDRETNVWSTEFRANLAGNSPHT